MAILKDRIVILKSINFSEADKILTVFGRQYGKFTLIAKGIRKMESKNRGNMQTMSLAKVSFVEGQNMGVLTESDLIIPADFPLESMRNIERILVLLSKLLPEEEAEQVIFDALEKLMNEGLEDAMTNRFRLLVLKHLGLIPDYSFCHSCSKSKSELGKLEYYNDETLEFFCSDCGDKLTINGLPIRSADELRSNYLFAGVLDRYIANLLGKW
jgi:DNA repair protein RecO (recombination protein O)